MSDVSNNQTSYLFMNFERGSDSVSTKQPIYTYFKVQAYFPNYHISPVSVCLPPWATYLSSRAHAHLSEFPLISPNSCISPLSMQSSLHGRSEVDQEQMLPPGFGHLVKHLVKILTFCVTILTFCQNTNICSP